MKGFRICMKAELTGQNEIIAKGEGVKEVHSESYIRYGPERWGERV